MTRCARCVVRDDSPGILLDGQGICNACRTWEELGPALCDFERLGEAFRARVESARGRFAYDALVGVSGGKDGCFVLESLARRGLRVLAFTLDYGFMPNEGAKANLRRVVEGLGVEHVWVVPPRDLVQKIFRRYLSVPTNTSPCHMCTSVLGGILAYRLAIEQGVPLIVLGLDRGQMFAKLHLSHARERVLRAVAPVDPAAERRRVERGIKLFRSYFALLGLGREERRQLLPARATLPGTDVAPELLYYFLFHPYDEEAAKRLLERELGWARPAGDGLRTHHDCELKVAAACAAARLGLGERLEFELSVDVREGKLDRAAALERLGCEAETLRATTRPFAGLEEHLGMSAARFEARLGRLSAVGPHLARATNGLLRRVGFGGLAEQLVFLIRPH